VIADWQREVSWEANRVVVCANAYVPRRAMPQTYNLHAYDDAILHAAGMIDTERKGKLLMCNPCRRALLGKQPRQPKFALANFLYYGHEALPNDVRDDFARSSPFEQTLISRCRSSVITHHYVRKNRRGGYIPADMSQSFSRGNVAIFPQEPSGLRDVLPPARDDSKPSVNSDPFWSPGVVWSV